MQLTGKQIVEEGIITGFDTENAVQQQGIDVRVVTIRKVKPSKDSIIPAKGKTILPKYEEIPVKDLGKEIKGWKLKPGYYEIILAEGCKIPNNRAMTFVQRSSLLRSGCIIRSSQFDAGFETNQMGTFMAVFSPVKIEYMARVAQTIVLKTATVSKENLYNGQYQGK